MKKNLGKLQKIGKALMLPVAVLPVAGILLRLGVLWNIAPMTAAGDAVFGNLALIFAIGVAVGLAKENAGAAGLAGAVGYLVLTSVATSMNADINMGVLAGIISGSVAGALYNRYYNIELPDWLGFFSGKRFVPIATSVVCLIIGLVAGFAWPPIQSVIDSIGNWMITAGPVGAFTFGFANRMLIPLGLHHILNSIVWFVFGEFGGATGDLGRFFAGDPTAGVFMTGFYPIMMFGLPAAALAMYKAARKDQRHIVGGMLFSVAFTAFLTGITEPIEFMFMFIAPALYVIHAVLTGLAFVVTNLAGTLHGFSFSAGAIDYFLSFGIATKPLLLAGIGVGFGFVYYTVFTFAINKFNIATPGRFEEESEAIGEILEEKGVDGIATSVIDAIGGKSNIVEIDSCITRLRLEVKDASLVDEATLKSLGAAGVIKLSNTSIQIIMGTKAENIASSMKAAI